MVKLNYPEFWNKKGAYAYILAPFTLIFYLISFLRKILCTQHKLNAPVICIGNVTVGGTGKTALIKALGYELLTVTKKKITIITKGFGGKFLKPTIIEPNSSASIAGDEAIEIAEHLFNAGDATVIISKNPTDCQKLLAQIKPDLILIDDGMQNPSFYKDLTIVMVDGVRGFGNEMLLPSGPLRESYKTAINKTDLIVSINPIEKLKTSLIEIAGEKFIELHANVKSSLKNDDKLFITCAIGNPDKFYDSLKDQFQILGKLYFPDHHSYNQQDFSKIIEECERVGASKIVTTAKDYVKLRHFKSRIKIEVIDRFLNVDDLQKVIKGINEKISF